MRFIDLTQSLDQNDKVLGFFHSWVEAFAKACEQVTIIALRVGACALPNDVWMLSLGKEGAIFAGGGTPIEVRNQYRAAHVTINMLPTGGLDKVVLESLAAGVPALTSNQAWRPLFGEHAGTFMLPELNPESGSQLGSQLVLLSEHDIPLETRRALKAKVERDASHEALVRKMVAILS